MSGMIHSIVGSVVGMTGINPGHDAIKRVAPRYTLNGRILSDRLLIHVSDFLLLLPDAIVVASAIIWSMRSSISVLPFAKDFLLAKCWRCYQILWKESTNWRSDTQFLFRSLFHFLQSSTVLKSWVFPPKTAVTTRVVFTVVTGLHEKGPGDDKAEYVWILSDVDSKFQQILDPSFFTFFGPIDRTRTDSIAMEKRSELPWYKMEWRELFTSWDQIHMVYHQNSAGRRGRSSRGKGR